MKLKGVKEVRKKLADGTLRYYYHMRGEPGPSFYRSDVKISTLNQFPPDFIEAYKSRSITIEADQTYGRLVIDFRRSRKFARYADATKRDMERYLEMTLDIPFKDGKVARTAPLSVFDNVKIIPYINRWRDRLSKTPRQADLAVSALRRVLAFGCSEGRLSFNRAANIESLYDAPIDEGEGWPDKDFERFIGGDCPVELSFAARFIRYFGVRRTDAVKMAISAEKQDNLVWKTSKGRRKKRQAIAPILPEGRRLLDQLAEYRERKNLDTLMLLHNSRGRPWTPDGLSSSFDKRRTHLGITHTIHQLRKGYATDLVIAHCGRPHIITRAVVCRALGWGEEQLNAMIRVYVDDSKVIEALTNKPSPENGNQVETIATFERSTTSKSLK